MNYIAIDFETATASRNSACAIGLAIVRDGQESIGSGRWLIKPPGNDYDPFNISIHGITPEMTKNEPTLAELWPTIMPYLAGQTLVAHNAAFDISVLRHSLDQYNLPYPEFTYYCTRILAKRHWGDMSSYTLTLVADRCDISFNHHDPAEDAIAAAKIALYICGERKCDNLKLLSDALQVNPGQMFASDYKPCCGPATKRSIRDFKAEIDDFDETNPFYQASVVFTGAMESMPRHDAIQRLVNVGGIPKTSVSQNTDYLVVGLIDFQAFVAGKPSNKMKTANQLVADGGKIKVISEREFLEML